jgi:hypothetical protein
VEATPPVPPETKTPPVALTPPLPLPPPGGAVVADASEPPLPVAPPVPRLVVTPPLPELPPLPVLPPGLVGPVELFPAPRPLDWQPGARKANAASAAPDRKIDRQRKNGRM